MKSKTKNLLITGATGNVGQAVIQSLIASTNHQIFAAVRNIERSQKRFKTWTNNVQYRSFDFEDSTTFPKAFDNIDCLFLLRPPHISDVKKYFEPLLRQVKNSTIKEVVFLSVQGAEQSKIIPHNKIETAIKANQLDFVFLRPSYFMQNLTTTLLQDIQQKQAVILPAGNAKFNWIDVKNIGEVAAKVMSNFDTFKNRAIEITSYENKNFEEVTKQITTITGKKITYKNINPLQFFFLKKRKGLPFGKIIVMILLHYLPRFQAVPTISKNYESIIGDKPTTLQEFIEREKQYFTP